MNSLLALSEAKFLGLDWSLWSIIGFTGTAIFASRFFVQWVASERRRESIIPVSFWWISIIGSLVTGLYFIGRRDPVGIIAYVPNSLIYLRNLQLIHRKRPAGAGKKVHRHLAATPD